MSLLIAQVVNTLECEENVLRSIHSSGELMKVYYVDKI